MSAELEAEKYDPATHFGFGRNWAEFSRFIDEERIAESRRGLIRLLGREDLAGLAFLDIGCGSGLHALAALRLGAAPLLAVDFDEHSVATTRATLARFWPGAGYEVRQGNVFDLTPEALGRRFDVVYSWGVLHHTGDLWEAIRAASRLVAPGGLFAIALYKRTPLCGLWKREKAWFTRAGPTARSVAVSLFVAAKAGRDLLRLRNPWRRFRGHRAQRGMHWRADAVDWLGGHPYDSATPEQVQRFVEPLGFRLDASFHTRASLGVFGTGNAEYRFRRVA